MKLEELKLTQDWDKTFPKSDKVNHCKVTFPNRYGITLAADHQIAANTENLMTTQKVFLCMPMFYMEKKLVIVLKKIIQRTMLNFVV